MHQMEDPPGPLRRIPQSTVFHIEADKKCLRCVYVSRQLHTCEVRALSETYSPLRNPSTSETNYGRTVDFSEEAETRNDTISETTVRMLCNVDYTGGVCRQ